MMFPSHFIDHHSELNLISSRAQTRTVCLGIEGFVYFRCNWSIKQTVVALIGCSVAHYINIESTHLDVLCDASVHGSKHTTLLVLIADIHPSSHI